MKSYCFFHMQICILIVLGSCATRPSSIVPDEHVVVIKSVRLPRSEPGFTRFAEHSWIEMKGSERWVRVEVISRNSGLRIRNVPEESASSDVRWRRPVSVVGSIRGEKAKCAYEKILEVAEDYPWIEDYRPWPGPNSNTFTEWIIRVVPELSGELYPNAVGSDYTPVVRVGKTPSNTGFELETLIIGGEIGLREGIEGHFLGLSLGVSPWPPSLKLPFLPSIPNGFRTPIDD